MTLKQKGSFTLRSVSNALRSKTLGDGNALA